MIIGAKGSKRSLRVIFLRIILAFLLVPLIYYGREELSVFFFVLAALLGFFEGYFQKRMPFPSQARMVLDFTADKFLVNLTTITLAVLQVIPYWVAILFFVRDLLTFMGGALMVYKSDKTEFKPTITGKMSLFFQYVSLVPALMGNPDQGLLVIASVVTVISAVEAFFKSEFRKTRRRSDLSQFSLVKMIKIPDLISLANVMFGLASIVFAINARYELAASLMAGAVVLDYFDGKVARWLKQEHEFGRELDSLADTVSFGVTPAIFAYSLTQAAQLGPTETNIAVISFTIFVFCGILRLARYNIMHLGKEFAGMPITMNGIIIPLIYFAGLNILYYPYVYLFLGFLMVSSLRIPKLG